jgi:hypothetical protein
MPALVAPVAACKSELRSIPEPDVEEDEPNALDSSEFRDDTELMLRESSYDFVAACHKVRGGTAV